MAGPRGVVRRRSRRGLVPRHAEAVVVGLVASSEGGVRVGMVARVVGVMHGHRALVLRALRVLPLPLVRVLVPAQRLRRREVPAAVVALELPGPSSAAAVTACRRFGSGVVGGAFVDGAIFFHVGGGGRPRGSGVRWDVDAEQPDAGCPGASRRRLLLLLLAGCGRRADERQLREGVDARGRARAAAAGVPAVMRISLAHPAKSIDSIDRSGL